MRKNFGSFVLLVLLGIISSPFCLSQGLVPCGPGTQKPVCELCDFFILLENIFDFLLVPSQFNSGFPLVLILAGLFIVVGGFYLIIYPFLLGESSEHIRKGKTIIFATLIGLLIVYSAWFVVNLFFQIIGVQEWTGLRTWWQINCP